MQGLRGDVCYAIGALRDGSIEIRVGKNYEIRYNQRCYHWLVELQRIFYEHYGVRGSIRPWIRGTYMLRINDKNTTLEFADLCEYKTPQREWTTPSIIKQQTLGQQLCYVQGFWDAEGGLPHNPSQSSQFYLSFDQENYEALNFIRSVLLKLNFNPTNITRTGKCWQFRLTRKEEIIRYAREISTRHPDKQSRMRSLTQLLLP